MIVLAVDTTHEFGSLALNFGSETLGETPLHEPGGFAGVLFEQIQTLLDRHNLKLDEVDVYAAASGPGSFTGVRIGLAAVKALAEAKGKPCFGVSVLAAMASYGTAPQKAAILDARRGEIYGGLFGVAAGPETVAPFPVWLASLPPGVGEFVAFDFLPFDSVLDASPFAHAARTKIPRSIAGAVAEIALDLFRAGENGDPALLDANYVRRSDAELAWKDESSIKR